MVLTATVSPALGPYQGVGGRASGAAAEQAVWPGLVTVGKNRERSLFRKHVVAAQAESAPEFTGPLGIGHQFVPGDAYRVIDLGFFDRGVLGVLTVALDCVGAIGSRAPAKPPGERFEEAVVLARFRVFATETGVALHGFSPGGNDVGHRRGKRLENQVVQPNVGLPAANHRGRVDTVGNRALGRMNLHVPIKTVVHGQVTVHQRPECICAGRECLGECRIDRSTTLGV